MYIYIYSCQKTIRNTYENVDLTQQELLTYQEFIYKKNEENENYQNNHFPSSIQSTPPSVSAAGTAIARKPPWPQRCLHGHRKPWVKTCKKKMVSFP